MKPSKNDLETESHVLIVAAIGCCVLLRITSRPQVKDFMTFYMGATLAGTRDLYNEQPACCILCCTPDETRLGTLENELGRRATRAHRVSLSISVDPASRSEPSFRLARVS